MDGVDLSPWNFREVFTCTEVAFLIAGCDPYESVENRKIKMAHERIISSFMNTVYSFVLIYERANEIGYFEPIEVRNFIFPVHSDHLFPGFSTKDMQMHVHPIEASAHLCGSPRNLLNLLGVQGFMDDGERLNAFRNFCKKIVLERYEVVRWLNSENLQSVYQFNLRDEQLILNHSVAQMPSELAWFIKKPGRMQGYAMALLRALEHFQEISPQKPPTGRMVLEYWRGTIKLHPEIENCLPDEVSYYDSKGNAKYADLKTLGKTILRYTSEIEEG